ncbi:MAG: family 10 glycosylhydrolase [Oscillospiraceae bacterium]|jgi:uncharacterized lipoprotein YddW (UPF0748 family)|nr:family 10 glycosylhydrolase [Oscillospiraceae bacterium]
MMKKQKFIIIVSVIVLVASVIPFLIISINSESNSSADPIIPVTEEEISEYPNGNSLGESVYIPNGSPSDNSTGFVPAESKESTGENQEEESSSIVIPKASVDFNVSSANNGTPSTPAKSGEMRAIWIPYMSLTDISANKIDAMLDKAKSMGFNTIMFHVRPFGDAMYKSKYFPWSHIAAGTQGASPSGGFDPLGYAVTAAHSRGLALHAWINPLRIQLEGGKVPETIAASNPYNKYRNDSSAANDHYVVDYKDGKYYNPAEAEVRELIVSGIAEIAENYDVDGIHWDDYFYPSSTSAFDDGVSYDKYKKSGGTLSLASWRKYNIDLLVRASYERVKAINPKLIFGISPAGNIQNCLNAGADVKKWGRESGYVDYLCPQIYWTFDNSVAPYEEMCKKWRNIVTNKSVKLYIGLALYKAGSNSDSGKWKTADDIIAREIRYARSSPINADGFMVYSYDYLGKAQTKKEVANMVSEWNR